MMVRMAGAALCAGAILAAGAVFAQTKADANNRVGVHGDWGVYAADKPKECWAGSAPKSSENTRGGKPATVQRGDILLFVTFRNGGNASGEVSFSGGYPFAPKSTATLEVDGTKYELFTQGEWAWPRTPADDSGLLEALKKGTEATITAHSSRGTQTKDTFSLAGFTASVGDAQKACPVK